MRQINFLKYLIEFALVASFGMLLCLTAVGLVLFLLAHLVLICTGSKMLYFCLHSNIFFTCWFDFKGKAGGAGQVRQGASQRTVAMVSRSHATLEWWQETCFLSPRASRAGTFSSWPKLAAATAGNNLGSPLLQLSMVQPWVKAQLMSPLGTALPQVAPPWSRAAQPEATLGSLSSSSQQRIFCSAVQVCKRREFFISGPSVPSCKLDKCPWVTQPCSGSPVSGFLLAWAHFY